MARLTSLLLTLGALAQTLAQTSRTTGTTARTTTMTTTLAPATVETSQPRFMGYYVAPDSTERLTVSSGTVWATRSGYAGNCAQDVDLTDCAIATACFQSLITYDNGQTVSCPSRSACATMTIFETSPFGGPVVTNYACRLAWVAHTVYRQLATTTTGDPSDTTTSTGGPTATNTSDPGNGGDSGSSSGNSNLGAVLGGALGGAAALIIIVTAGIFFYRKKKRDPATQHLIPQSEKDAAAAAAAMWISFNGTPQGQGYPYHQHHPAGLSSNSYPGGYPGSVYPQTPGSWSAAPSSGHPAYGSDAKVLSGTGAVPYGPGTYSHYISQQNPHGLQVPPSELGTTTSERRDNTPAAFAGQTPEQTPGKPPAELPAGEVAEAPSSLVNLGGLSEAAVGARRESGSDSESASTSSGEGSPGAMSKRPATTSGAAAGTGVLEGGMASPTMGTGMGSMAAGGSAKGSSTAAQPSPSTATQQPPGHSEERENTV